MPTLRTYVLVLALILAFSSSATHAATTPTPTVSPIVCCGDCNGNGVVTQDEFQTCVPPIIPEAPFAPCPACDCNHDGNVGSAGELTQIVNNIVNGCPGAPPKTPFATPTPTPSCHPLPAPNLDFAFSPAPAHPVVGDHVQLSVTVSGDGGLPQYSLSGTYPIFEGDTSITVGGPLGTVTFNLTAVQAGTATLMLSVAYETAYGCEENPYFTFTSQTSPPFTLEVEAVSSTPTPTSTPTPPQGSGCVGDCNADGEVTVDEIVRMVNIAVNGDAFFNDCPGSRFWCNSDPALGGIEITCLIDAVNNLLRGCLTVPPLLSLSAHVARDPATQTLQVVADLSNSGEVPVSYLTGCSGDCRIKFYPAISFTVVDSLNTEVIVEDPCGYLATCAEVPRPFFPGESVEQALNITGTKFLWNPDPTSGIGDCGSCTQAPLEPGRYTVIPHFQYSTDLNNPWPFPNYIEASTQFDWP